MPLPNATYAPTGTFIDTILSGFQWDVTGSRTFTWAIADYTVGDFFVWDPALALPVIDDVLSAISDVINIDFQYVGHYADPRLAPADIVFSGTYFPTNFGYSANTTAFAYFPMLPEPYVGASGDVWINANDPAFSPAALADGGKAKAVGLHEVGHALGLKHSFQAMNGFPNVQAYGFTDELSNRHDSAINQSITVMSYDDASFFSNNFEGNPATLMPLDILALGYLYGLRAKNADNTTYSTFADGVFETLYDTGGIDTISAQQSAWSTGWTIDLGVTIDLASLVPAQGSVTLGFAQPNGDPNTFKWLVDPENALGSNFNDFLNGNAVANILVGNLGNDVLNGFDNNDTLIGGGGNDVLVGGPGADFLTGSGGRDTASYSDSGSRVDVRLINGRGFAGDAAGDRLSTIENLIGSDFNDLLVGHNGANVLLGGAGNDNLIGLGGNDALIGGTGNDTLTGGLGADILGGSSGSDTASYAGATTRVDARLISARGFAGEANGDTFSGIENLIGSRFGDRLDGDNGANRLSGGNGNDVISGFGGNDVLTGGSGADLLTGGAGADLLNGASGPDIANYSSAPGPVDARLINGRGFAGDALGDRYVSIEHVGGSNFGDRLFGNNGNNILAGRAGKDTLNGLGGNDRLSGGGSNDLLIGGSGDDLLAGGTGNDLFVFRPGDGADTITDFAAGAGPGDRIFFDNSTAVPDNFAQVQGRASQVGADTFIDLGGGDSITLAGVSVGTLSADDFLF